MTYRYAVLGAGRQGTAAAYDMAKFGDAVRVTLADVSLDAAGCSANRVNWLLGRPIADFVQLDVTDYRALVELLSDYDAFLSAVPYYLNLDIARAAVEAGVSMCDLGGNTALVRQQFQLDPAAKQAGISIIPDCGQVPGLGTTLCCYAMQFLDRPREVYLYDGGLPQRPQPPWNYVLTFNVGGLTNEYFGTTVFIRDGKLVEVPCFQEYEEIEIPGVGKLEAFTTAGGTSTMPWTFEGRLDVLMNKTLRFPPHYAQFKAFSDAGLLDLTPVQVGGVEVVPRDVLHALLTPRLTDPEPRDIVVIRVVARGDKGGRPARVVLDLLDRYDQATGFTAMERTTGWHAAIVCEMMARGETPKGAVPLELAVPGDRFVAQLRQRGIEVTETVESCRLEG
jgi:lysine 6-dehydrogenase